MLKGFFGSRRGFVRYLRHWIADRVLFSYRRFYRIPSKVDRVVFVCKGNVCRSPFAEHVFKQLTNIPAVSLGLNTTTGCEAHPPILDLAKEMGQDLSSHRTTALRDFTIQENDVFVCTEPAHIDQLVEYFPNANVILIGGFTSPRVPYIHDPYNTSDIYRRRCLRVLKKCTESLASQLDKSC